MPRTRIRTLTTNLSALAVVAAVMPACGGGGGTKNPGEAGNPAAAVLDPTKASKEAKADFRTAVASYQSLRADGSLSTADCESASSKFHKVYKEHGKQMAVAYFNAGAVWEECGQPDKAKEIYERLTKDVPKYDLGYNNLGVIAWQKGDERQALAHFKKAVEVNPKTRAPRNNLAAALRDKYSSSPESSDFAAAEKELQRVLAVDSANQLAYENLARLYYDRGRLKDKSYLLLANLVVDQALRVLKEEGRESADLYNLQGLLRMQDNDQVAALRSFKKAAEANPDLTDAHLNIAMISIRFRAYEEASTHLEKALKDPRQATNPETHLAYGVAQRGLRKFDVAEKAFKQAQTLNNKDPRPVYNLGILYHEHIAPRQEEFSKDPYNTASAYFDKFVGQAKSDKGLATVVADAQNRIDSIKDFLKSYDELKKLEAEAKKLEELQRQQEEEERKRLLDLEAQAIKAAEEAAKAEEEAANAAANPPAKEEPKKEEPKKDEANDAAK